MIHLMIVSEKFLVLFTRRGESVTCQKKNLTYISINFQLIQKNVQYGPVKCQLWQKIEVIGERKNTYSLWVDQTNGYPVRFEMMGYDSLLGSHYDKYYLEYEKYIPQDVQDSVFDPTTRESFEQKKSFSICLKFIFH